MARHFFFCAGFALALLINVCHAQELPAEEERFGGFETDDFDESVAEERFGWLLPVAGIASSFFSEDEFADPFEDDIELEDDGFVEYALNEELADELAEIDDSYSDNDDGVFCQVEDRFFKWIAKKVKKVVKKVKKIGTAVLPYVKKGYKYVRFAMCLKKTKNPVRCSRYLRSKSGAVGGPWCPRAMTTRYDEEALLGRERRQTEGDTDYAGEETVDEEIGGSGDERRGGFGKRRYRRCRHHLQCYRYGKVCCGNRALRSFVCQSPRLRIVPTKRGALVMAPSEAE